MRAHWFLSGALLAATAAAAVTLEPFNTTPPPISPDFSCSGRPMGYYADLGTKCRAYHTCDDHGNHFTNYCPEDTAFRQDAMICDHAHLVECGAAELVGRVPATPLDASHEAFSEPRGEGTNARGFARSYRIKPEAQGDSKYPTFVLNSSVFLADRERPTHRDSSRSREEPDVSRSREEPNSSRSREEPNASRSKEVPNVSRSREEVDVSRSRSTSSEEQGKDASISSLNSQESPSRNLLAPTPTPRVHISELLEPPAAPPPSASEVTSDEDFSFLDPPFEDSAEFRASSFESLRNSAPGDSIRFSPRTEMILGMVQARALGRSRPSDFLEPPESGTSHSADYPYVETLRSIQQHRPTLGSHSVRTPAATATSTAATEAASIFEAPLRPLLSAGEVEVDPYYPRQPSTTEAYYTPRHEATHRPSKPFFATTRRPFTGGAANFQIPEVLPDLNSLEDLLDRRKFFFIPRIKSL